eukprot:GHUV01004663.1.p1 GENE.GHUV01004663.1~~GHUV01004663.1.p1  ORF type:complete len:142 (+),score=29.35 GHUV01004663.1:248-673(+)
MESVSTFRPSATFKRPTHVQQQCLGPHRAVRSSLIVSARKTASASGQTKQKQVTYGKDWYAATRDASKPFRTVREEIEYRREANRLANNGKERKDLYSANWDGDQYKGSSFNVLTVIAAISVLVPLAGLVFAYTTFGVLWG